MASIGSLSFTIETRTESSVLAHSGNYRRPWFRFSAYRSRKSVECANLNDSSFGHLKAVESNIARISLCCQRVIHGCKRGGQWRIRHLRATSKGSVEGEDGDESEDALQATIEKSKKVLAMQRDLLQQIAERRKLVSSIKDTIIDPKDDKVSYEEGDNSFENLDLDSSQVITVLMKTMIVTFFLSGYVHSTADEISETLPPSRGFGESEKERGKSLALNKASLDVDAPKQLKDTSLEMAWSDGLPSIHVNSFETSTLKAEKHEDFRETSLPDVNSEANVPMGEDVIPPPLAGANVMNVILVAAECAPWSKTGGLGDVAGALPKALARRGHRVMVVAPRYGNYAEPKETGVRKIYKVDGQDVEVTYFHAYIDGVDFVFLDGHMFRHIENNIYTGNRMDILKRMVLFCKAAVEVPWHVPCGGICYGDGNLAFIANDWHTALLPVYLKAYYRDNGLMIYTRSILVIHNISSPGSWSSGRFQVCGFATTLYRPFQTL
ncbi:hypothetical protein L1049_002534 [Liquidambar formosana]|uniref:starch synthase n=1 Tax=Liquidambar formosana TaxID=63359 RepID=A0AAP0NFU7_LIQFO